ncbi:MAG: hypothetical protein AAFU79_03980 [Myxococcota bacterium]
MACAASPAAPPRPEAELKPGSPEWVRAIMERELTLPEQAVPYAVRGHSGTMLSRGPLKTETLEAEGMVYFAVDVGANLPFECYLYDEAVDIATSISQIADSVISKTAGEGTIEVKQFVDVGADLVAKRPFLEGMWLYRARRPEGAQFGALKVFGLLTDVQVSICIHNEPGYAKSFRAWFRDFAAQYRNTTSSTRYQVVEVSIDRLNDATVGFSRTRAAVDEEGDYRVETQTSMLIPRNGEAAPVDRFRVVFADAEGGLINQIFADAEGSVLNVDPVADGYRVHGTLSGKNVEFPVATQGRIGSVVTMNRSLQQAARTAGTQEFSFSVHQREAPDQLTEVEIIEQGPNEDGLIPFDVRMGPMKINALFEPPGKPVSAKASMGPVQVKSEVVLAEGEW